MDPSPLRELRRGGKHINPDVPGQTEPAGPDRRRDQAGGRLRDRREHLSKFSCNCANLEPPETDGNQHLQNSGSLSQKSETAGGKGNGSTGRDWTTLAAAITPLTRIWFLQLR